MSITFVIRDTFQILISTQNIKKLITNLDFVQNVLKKVTNDNFTLI